MVSLIMHSNELKNRITLQVFQHLQKLNICMSHQGTTTLVNILGFDHDAKVITWGESLCEELGNTA